jgi:hypothetical protein
MDFMLKTKVRKWSFIYTYTIEQLILLWYRYKALRTYMSGTYNQIFFFFLTLPIWLTCSVTSSLIVIVILSVKL